jgi:hypothetical protein
MRRSADSRRSPLDRNPRPPSISGRDIPRFADALAIGLTLRAVDAALVRGTIRVIEATRVSCDQIARGRPARPGRLDADAICYVAIPVARNDPARCAPDGTGTRRSDVIWVEAHRRGSGPDGPRGRSAREGRRGRGCKVRTKRSPRIAAAGVRIRAASFPRNGTQPQTELCKTTPERARMHDARSWWLGTSRIPQGRWRPWFRRRVQPVGMGDNAPFGSISTESGRRARASRSLSRGAGCMDGDLRCTRRATFLMGASP